MDIEVDKVYLKNPKFNGHPTIRKVISIIDDVVNYKNLWGQQFNHGQIFNHTKLKKFIKWAQKEIPEEVNHNEYYKYIKGATIYKNYVVKGINGNDVFTCTEKRAKFYLKKGFAKQLDDSTLQMCDPKTEQRMEELWGKDLSPFFMAIKNDKCVVCGSKFSLTRHHVVPKRHKHKLNLSTSTSISNVLFVCWTCHRKYEDNFINWEPDFDVTNPLNWKDHFCDTMQPKFLPIGWQIVSVTHEYEVCKSE